MLEARTKRWALIGAAYLAAFIALDYMSYIKPYGNFGVTPWNPQRGTSLALLYLGGLAYAPFVLLAQLTSSFVLRSGPLGLPLELALSLVGGGAALLASWRLRSFQQFDPRFPTVRDVLRFIIVLLVATVASSFIFTIVLAIGGELGRGDFAIVTWGQFVGDFIGALVVTPVLLMAFTVKPWPRANSLWYWQLGTIAVALFIVFGYREATAFQLFYLLFLPLLWISLTHGTPGAAVALFVIQIGLIIGAEVRFGNDPGLAALQVLMIALATTGFLVGAIFTEREIAAVRIRDQQMALNRALRARAAGEIAAGIAHEVNQPLTAIRTYASVASNALERGESGLARESIDKLVSQSDRAAKVIRSIRELLHQGTVDAAPTNLAMLLGDYLELMAAELALKGILLQSKVPSNFPIVVVDGVQLTQALHNLVTNGAEAMEGIGQKGTINIDVTRMNNSEFAITVSDNGPGFPPGFNIDEPPPFVTTKAEGSGIGLSIARTIAEAHEGSLKIRSSVAGATASIILPLVEAKNEQAHFDH